MSAWDGLVARACHYFRTTHLKARDRINAHMLMRAYATGAVAMSFVTLHGVLASYIFSTQIDEAGIITSLWMSLILVGLVEVARQGYLLHSGWIMGSATLAYVLYDIHADGALNAMVCALMLPIIIFSFIHAKRSILAYSVSSYIALMGMAAWCDASRTIEVTSEAYSLSTVILVATIIVFSANFVTWTVMAIEQESLDRVSQSMIAMKQAKQEALEQSVEAESARQEVMLTQRAKARYLANMSHELRTPLSTIISYSELLDESLEEIAQAPAHVRRDVSLIRASGEHLLCRINDILDLSRLEAGKMPRHEEAIRLDKIFEQAEQFAMARAGSGRGVHVTWPAKTQFEALEVLCDELLVVKLIAHLLLHLKQDGPISVFVVPQHAHVDVVFKLRFWTIPPDTKSLAKLEPGHLNLLLYRALIEALEIPFEEPHDQKAGTWKISLNTL